GKSIAGLTKHATQSRRRWNSCAEAFAYSGKQLAARLGHLRCQSAHSGGGTSSRTLLVSKFTEKTRSFSSTPLTRSDAALATTRSSCSDRRATAPPVQRSRDPTSANDVVRVPLSPSTTTTRPSPTTAAEEPFIL